MSTSHGTISTKIPPRNDGKIGIFRVGIYWSDLMSLYAFMPDYKTKKAYA